MEEITSIDFLTDEGKSIQYYCQQILPWKQISSHFKEIGSKSKLALVLLS